MPSETTYSSIPSLQIRDIPKVSDFSEVLQKHGLTFRAVDFHWLVGEVTQVQGWILHISVVRWQTEALLNSVIPVLIEYQAAFKVVKDMNAVKNLLDGELGPVYVGKVISVYTTSIEQCVDLAKELIRITQPYKGPAILTDIHLGGNVYTRYGGFQPVILPDAYGKNSRWIYNRNGELVPDIPTIPFQMPAGQVWPFDAIAKPEIPQKNSILNGTYKPLFNLKSNAKGNVMKALYVKNIFFVKKCVIKEAKKDMWSDEAGRDIRDRLAWQKELYEQLAEVVPMPKILDLFYDTEDAYLTMEFVEGVSLYDYQFELNKQSKAWHTWPVNQRLQIIGFLLQIISILTKMHEKGFVHRDVTPVNFLVGKKNKLVLIDIELAYSTTENRPTPPFEFGTHGFMSREQMEIRTPQKEEDIYALGATMITLLAGLPPTVFDEQDKEIIFRHLNFFVRNREVSSLITRCLDPIPERRPPLEVILQRIMKYREQIKKGTAIEPLEIHIDVTRNRLKALIEGAIRGLVSEPTLIDKNLWYSKDPNNIAGTQKKGYSKSGGLFEGITGVLYFLGKAQKAGFNVQYCQKAYEAGWKYINSNYLRDLSNITPGLYGGAAGIAVALAAGMEGKLLADTPANREVLQEVLKLPVSCPDIASGAAGQGLAILHCRNFFEQKTLNDFLNNTVDFILESQDNKGVWVMLKDGKERRFPAANFSYGNTGITWFLQVYNRLYEDIQVQAAIWKSLNVLKKLTSDLDKTIQKKGFRNLITEFQTRNGITGIILNFIQAYEMWHEPLYKTMAEQLLIQFPPCLVHEEFTQDAGIASMGELYLDAARVFNNKEWKERATWIAQFFINTCKKGANDSYYWLTNNLALPTADFMCGNSGIIHFLIRYYAEENLDYRLTP